METKNEGLPGSVLGMFLLRDFSNVWRITLDVR